jgi:RNA polymerase sigma-70 factor (ECF subfamily)
MIDERAARAAAERAARESYGKLLAYLARRCGSVDAAQEALADAFAAALERWPVDGVPAAPEAWLLVAARHRFFDRVRRERRAGGLHERLVVAAQQAQAAYESDAVDGDERIGLLFACAHPAIARGMRAPLMLQAVLGFDAARIGAAFLVAPATMGQRLVRAKQKIALARIPFAIPGPDEFPDRLDAVLDAIYAVFAQGWDDPATTDPRTRGLVAEAMWLGGILAATFTREPEVLGLLALMMYANARTGARRAADGAYVPLDEQDVGRWDHAAIDDAERVLARAAALGSAGRFQLEAAIQSAHLERRFGRAPNWPAIVALYDELLRRTASPVVALNRAVAIGRVHGPRAGLDAIASLAHDERLRSYQPYWATVADLSARAGLLAAADAAYASAIGLAIDPSVRAYLADKRASPFAKAAAATEGAHT